MKRLFTLLIALFIIVSFQNLSFACDHQFRSSITAKGVVKDEDGDPLTGATITEKEKNNFVIRVDGGAFSITVNEGTILTITSVGFETHDVPVITGDMIITIVRRDNLSEVVVTALGIKKDKTKNSKATQEVKCFVLE
jgi:hypothetical protein